MTGRSAVTPSPTVEPDRGAPAPNGNRRSAVAPSHPSGRLDPASIAETLGATNGSRRARRLGRRLLRWGVPALIVAAGVWYVVGRRGPARTTYETIEVRRGSLTVTVTATGTLAPLDTVEVGTEVSGIVDTVAVDFNDRVRRGQLLAVVNTDQLRAQIRQGEAALAAAEALARQGAATLAEMRAQAGRADSLFARAMISPQDLEGAHASLARAEGAVAVSQAQTSSAAAALDAQRTTLGKATIRSPIDGIVLERTVGPGRTVAAAFQTPVLFVLAADLTRMTLALDIDEADIAQVQQRQEARFTVDAYPDRVFTATVRSVRNAAKTVEGVVTYQAILDVANRDRSLRPGMTATASIVTAEVRDALLVPNAALRFTPASDSVAGPKATGRAAVAARRVWMLRSGAPVAVSVQVGLSDGQWTELTGPAPAAGTPLITDVRTAEDASTPAGGGATPGPRRPRGLFGG